MYLLHHFDALDARKYTGIKACTHADIHADTDTDNMHIDTGTETDTDTDTDTDTCTHRPT